MKVFATAGPGGSGKSQVAGLLTRVWREQGLRVRLVDLDPDGSGVGRLWDSAWSDPPIPVTDSTQLLELIDAALLDEIDVVILDAPPMFDWEIVQVAWSQATTVLVVVTPGDWPRARDGMLPVLRGFWGDACPDWPGGTPILVNRALADNEPVSEHQRELADELGVPVEELALPDFEQMRQQAREMGAIMLDQALPDLGESVGWGRPLPLSLPEAVPLGLELLAADPTPMP